MTTATPTPTTDERIATRLADLTEQRAAIPEDGQLPLSTTREAHTALIEQRATLDRRIAAIHAAAAEQAALGSSEADEQWRDLLTSARERLCDELLAIKSPIRDKHLLGVSRNVMLSIGCVDKGRQVFTDSGWELENSKLGDLLRAAGYVAVGRDPQRSYAGQLPWYGSLPEVERRIANHAQRRQAAQVALDEALMDDDERARRDAESAAYRRTLDELRLKGSDYSDGKAWHLVPHRADGSVIPESELTAQQREALARANS